MKAALPVNGVVERDGTRLHLEPYGHGDVTIAQLPTRSIIDARRWKFQLPYVARHHRVIRVNGGGRGRSDRPRRAAADMHVAFTADTLAVLEATGTERVVTVAFSRGGLWDLQVAADQPGRMLGLVTICPAVLLAPSDEPRDIRAFDGPIERPRAGPSTTVTNRSGTTAGGSSSSSSGACSPNRTR